MSGGRGKPVGASPSNNAIQEFFQKIDSDAEWFPGKASDTKRGPKRLLRGPKVTASVSAAKRLKAEGDEPTYSAMVAACPLATLNPTTEEPVDKKLVYTVFRVLPRLAQTALDQPAIERRLFFANHMLTLKHTDKWFYNNIVWVDFCRSVLPRTQRKAKALALEQRDAYLL